MFISYAQNLEDVMLWRALGHIEKGRYVDIGAHDPEFDSVSRAFYEHGWRGVHVEPIAECAHKLQAARPDEIVIQAAVDTKSGDLAFFEVLDTGLSTADAKIAERHAQAGYQIRNIRVPSVTLDAVFAQAGAEVHWLKIDVEGFERRVLAGWRTSTVRPWIVVIESTLPMTTTPAHREWERLLLAKSYRFAYFDGLNRFYVSSSHPELVAAFDHGPSVFDNFALSGTASSTFAAKLNENLRSSKAEHERIERDLVARLQAAKDLQDHLAEERQLRERELAAKLHDAQEAALRIAQSAAERDRELVTNLRETQQQAQLRETAAAEVERNLAAGLRDAQQQLAQSAQNAAEHERKLTRELLDLQQQAAQRAQAAAERENALSRNLLDLQQEAAQHARAAAEREAELSKELRNLQQEAAHDARTAADREQKLADELRELRGHAAQLARSAESRLRDLQTRMRQRLQDLAQQLVHAAQDADSATARPFQRSKMDRYYLSDFDEYHGGAFVHAAYQALLKRAPDPDGFAYYKTRLGQGIAKARILGEICYSVEGKRVGVVVEGLKLSYAVAVAAHWPVIGALLRFTGVLRHFQDAERRRQAVENRFARLREEASIRAKSDATLLERILRELDSEADKLRALLEPTQGTRRQQSDKPIAARARAEAPHPARTLYYFVDHTVLCPVNTGMQRVARQLARALLELGERVEFVKWEPDSRRFVLVNRDELRHLCEWNGPRLSAADQERYPAAGAAFAPMSAHSAGSPDWLVVPEVTHITFQAAPTTLPAIMEAKRQGLKTAFIFHDAIPLRRRELEGMASGHAAYMQHLLLADLVIPNSKWSERDLVTFFAVHERATPASGPRVATLPLAGEVQLSERNVSSERPAAAQPLILSVGSIEPRKNQLALIRAFDGYCGNHPDTPWELALVGNLHPDVADELMTVVRRNKKIQYLAHVPDEELSRLYQACAFTVFPSVEEGCGLPILESLWHGKPCIAANFGSMAEVAEGGGCLTVDTRNPEQLRMCIDRMIDEPGLIEQLSLEATKRPIDRWSDYAGRFARLLDEESDPLRCLGSVYYWIDHTVTHPANSGIQRVARMLARALMDLGVSLIPAKWDQTGRRLYSPSAEELAHFSRWNGPAPSAWSRWQPPEQASARDWLLIPELTTYLNPTSLADVRGFAVERGLRTAIVFHDAIPWKMKDIYPPEATHAHRLYMEHLNLFEKVFPNSNASRVDLIEFLAATDARTPNLDSRVKTCALPGEFLESARTAEIKVDRARAVRILSVGTVEPRKNHLALLQAFAKLTRMAQRPVELVMAGGAPHPDLEAKVRKIVSSTPGIRWEREADDAKLRALYAECDFTVYPSLEEGFGLPILESVWNARPCICRNSGAMAEAAEAGGCLTVDTADPDALAEAMLRMVDDDALRDELARAAVRRPIKTWREYAFEIAADLAAERPLADPEARWDAQGADEFYGQAVNLRRRPLLSVCITTYNRAAWLAVALKNLFREVPAAQEDVEIVVCDNTSTDDTPQVVQPWLGRPDFTYHRNSANVGMLGNLRVTAHSARGQYIWILGDDDLVGPGSVQRTLAAIRGNPGVALVYLNYAYTREADARSVTDLDAFLANGTPIVAPGPDIAEPIHRISAASENFFTAIYCLVFRRDHALRAYSQNTEGRPFSSLLTCIPTTHHVLNHMMNEPGYWVGQPQLVVNMNVSWMRYAPVWILERIPEVYDLAEKMGANAGAVDRWRINNLPGVLHFFAEIYSNDPEGNAEFFSPARLFSRLKHLAEFRAMVPALREIYDVAHRDGRPAAEVPPARLFSTLTPD